MRPKAAAATGWSPRLPEARCAENGFSRRASSDLSDSLRALDFSSCACLCPETGSHFGETCSVKRRRFPAVPTGLRIYLNPSDSRAVVKKWLIFIRSCANLRCIDRRRGRHEGRLAGPIQKYPMMLRSAASPGSVGSAGRRWHIVASSYRCQTPTGPLLQTEHRSSVPRHG